MLQRTAKTSLENKEIATNMNQLHLGHLVGDRQLFILALLWCMPLASREELQAVARLWGAPNFPALLRQAVQDRLIFQVQAGFYHNRQNRFALTRRGVMRVCQASGLEPDWQVTEAGLRRLLMSLDTLEAIYSMLTGLFLPPPSPADDRNRVWPVKSSRDGRIVEAVHKMARLTWFPEGRVAAVMIDSNERQIPVMRVGALVNPDVLGSDTTAVYAGLPAIDENGVRSSGHHGARPSIAVFIVDDDYGFQLVDQILARGMPKMVVDRTGRILQTVNWCEPRGRLVEDREQCELGVPENLAETIQAFPPCAQRTGPNAVKIVDTMLERRGICDRESLIKILGDTQGTYGRRALNGWLEQSSIEICDGNAVLTPNGMDMLADRYWVPIEVVRTCFPYLDNAANKIDPGRLARFAVVANIAAAMQAHGSWTTPPWQYALRVPKEDGNGESRLALDVWLEDPGNPGEPTALFYGDSDDPQRIFTALEPFLHAVHAGIRLPLRVVCETRSIELLYQRHGAHLAMRTATVARLTDPPDNDPKKIWQAPQPQRLPADPLLNTAIRRRPLHTLHRNPFGLVRG